MLSTTETFHEDFPLDNLMSGPIVDDGVSSKFLTTRRAFQVALSVIRLYHVGVALNERSSTFFLVVVE